jgi:hypothetical protein
MTPGQINGRAPAFATDGPDDKGLTKREMFSISILKGLVSGDDFDPTHCLQLAVKMADDLLEELVKTPSHG